MRTSQCSLSLRFLLLGIFFVFILYHYSENIGLQLSPPAKLQNYAGHCLPSAYNDGEWIYQPRTNKTVMVDKDEAMEFAGFAGCASSREFHWHLGAGDQANEYARFPNVNSWQWKPSKQCNIREYIRDEFVRDLVEQGGWLVLGDSVTEGHFFSLSCLLSPHVHATPDYVKNPFFDRAWPQNLYLKPDSPLVSKLSFPPGFNISSTPLVTFRRVDHLISEEEMVNLYNELYHPPADFQLLNPDQKWNLRPDYYLDLFTKPLPEANYGTVIFSTGGHWTTSIFRGFYNQLDFVTNYGMDKVLKFFKQAMTYQATLVQAHLDKDGGYITGSGKKAKRRAVVRAYLPGHDGCHNYHEPVKTIIPLPDHVYNWANIWQFNDIFQRVLSSAKFPDVHFLMIDKPGRLRPDTHVNSDCLHIMAGPGVTEGWSHYIWHFISRELGYQM